MVFSDNETSNDVTTSPRKASKKARETMHANLADDSGHLDLDDSDADPDFVPEKKKKKKIVLTMKKTTLIFFYQVWLLTRPALMNIMIKAYRKRRIQETRERETICGREK